MCDEELVQLRKDLESEKGQHLAAEALAIGYKRTADKLERKNAAMREALQVLHDDVVDYVRINHLGDDHCTHALRMAHAALQSEAGSDLLTREQVRLLQSCLEHIKTTALECREKPEIVLAAVGLSACGGVAYAKSLGL